MSDSPPRNDEPEGILEDYLGIKRRTLYVLAAVVAVVIAAVIGIYVSIWGLERWKKNMSRAGDAMVINFEPQPMAQAVQYTCPTCGAVGLPLWDENAVPHCPKCGRPMSAR